MIFFLEDCVIQSFVVRLFCQPLIPRLRMNCQAQFLAPNDIKITRWQRPFLGYFGFTYVRKWRQVCHSVCGFGSLIFEYLKSNLDLGLVGKCISPQDPLINICSGVFIHIIWSSSRKIVWYDHLWWDCFANHCFQDQEWTLKLNFWLQMTSKSQDGSARFRNILASLM